MGSPVEDTSALWNFFVVVVLTVIILLVAVGAAVVIGHRRLSEAHSEFTRRLVAVQDEERARVSAEVHDDIGVQAAMIRSTLLEHASALPDGRTPLLGAADELHDLVQRTRKLAHRLHPTRVDQMGLRPALTRLAEDLMQELGLTMHLDAPDTLLVDNRTAYALFRISQEALRNAARHGGAREGWVVLRQGPQAVDLEVRDTGRGFDPSRRSPGLGLQLMRERAAIVGGSVRITSRPGAGTIVRARIPGPPAEVRRA